MLFALSFWWDRLVVYLTCKISRRVLINDFAAVCIHLSEHTVLYVAFYKLSVEFRLKS